MDPIGSVRGLFRGMSIPASGLSAQRRRIDTIAMNIANMQTTQTADGGPYRRRIVQLQEADHAQDTRGGRSPSVRPVREVGAASYADVAAGVEVVGVQEDPSEGVLKYDPSHPDANADGYVEYPNVNYVEEALAQREAVRAYEANASVFDAMKTMLRRAIQI